MPDIPATAIDLTDEFVLARCDFFTQVQLWPLRTDINPRRWLDNFLEHERRHAHYLLNSFIYFSTGVVEQVVCDNVEALSRNVVLDRIGADPFGAWVDFVDEMRVVIVRGEDPHPTDSGYIFSRIARDRLGIPESNILDVPDALRALKAGLGAPIVFLDDFVGSGDQFVDTWTMDWEVDGEFLRFADYGSGPSTFHYCPVLTTSIGANRIASECPSVQLIPGHELSERYSAFDSSSLVWPDDLRDSAESVIREASIRAGIPDLDGGQGDWRGYHKLGLTVGFSHGVPDATLPIYWWESDTWNPLKKRPYEP